MTNLPKIRILLCTFNGAAFLRAQLESYLAQTYGNWSLWVSDDGSTDTTLDIISDFQAENPGRDIRVISGPGRGMTANYMSLICHPDLGNGLAALSDQDDVWLPGKLMRAYEKMCQIPEDGPIAYGAKSFQVDAELNVVGKSRLPEQGFFGNAMVQNVLAGNTTLLNNAALDLLRKGGVPDNVPFHDWWIYLLITGAGGSIILDQEPVLYYRQHGTNALGARAGLAAFKTRWQLLGSDVYRNWLNANQEALRKTRPVLTEHAKELVDVFHATQDASGLRKAGAFLGSGIRRQSLSGNSLLLLACLLGKV